MVLHFGLSHCANGLSKRQNLALVLYANLLLLPTLHKIIKKELILNEVLLMAILGIYIFFTHTHTHIYMHVYIYNTFFLSLSLSLSLSLVRVLYNEREREGT